MPSAHDRLAVEGFVSRLYLGVLGRGFSSAELDAWTLHVMRTEDVAGVAKAFLSSSEYASTPRALADHVQALYLAFLARHPTTPEAGPWVDYLAALRGTVADVVLASPEFQERYRVIRPSP